jgi:hypothetical protein
MGWNSLSITVEFLITGFFRGALDFSGCTPATYLDHIVSMVRFPDLVLLISPSTCTDTVEPVLPVKVCWQKFTWRKIRMSKTPILSIVNPISYRSPWSFSIAVFFRGELFKILTFWGPAGVRVLFYLNFIWKYRNVHLQQKQTRNTPCQIWYRIWNPALILV